MLLTLDFLYSTMVFLSDAPLAQLDRALDFGRRVLRTERVDSGASGEVEAGYAIPAQGDQPSTEGTGRGKTAP